MIGRKFQKTLTISMTFIKILNKFCQIFGNNIKTKIVTFRKKYPNNIESLIESRRKISFKSPLYKIYTDVISNEIHQFENNRINSLVEGCNVNAYVFQTK